MLRGANRAGFAIGAYDHSRELVIDPILTFSTYFGGSGDEHASSVAVDGSFNIYLAGSTTSPNLPAAGIFQTTLQGAQNVYVAKITPPLGSLPAVLDYVTYLGGNGTDGPVGNPGGWPGRSICGGHDVFDEFPDDRDQCLPGGSGTGQHGHVARIRDRVAVRRHGAVVFVIPFGQWHRRRERDGHRRVGQHLRYRDDHLARRRPARLISFLRARCRRRCRIKLRRGRRFSSS